MDSFVTPINLEVQHASEAAIAAIERAGGTVTTAYYDPYSLSAATNPLKFFKRGALCSDALQLFIYQKVLKIGT